MLSSMFRHYMTHDALIGYRPRANRKPFRLLRRLPGSKKRFKEVKVKNFFEISTDSHGFIANKPGQERNYASIAEDSSIYKILVIGNSVTTGYGTKSGEYSWPALLETSLNENKNFLSGQYQEVVVINASLLGTELTQDLARFQNETIFLNPDLVVVLGGGAAKYEYSGNPVDANYHDVQNRMNKVFNTTWLERQNVVLPNVFSFLHRVFHANKENDLERFPFRRDDYVQINAAQLTLSKIKQFKGICDAHSINFLFFLQPVMGVGKKRLTKHEEKLITYFERYFFEMEWDHYKSAINHYFDALRPSMTEDYQIDLVDIFKDEQETVYVDPRHQNELGHEILAHAVETTVRALLSKSNEDAVRLAS